MGRKGITLMGNVAREIRFRLEQHQQVYDFLLKQLDGDSGSIGIIANVIPPCEEWEKAFGLLQAGPRPEVKITAFIFFQDPVSHRLACEIFGFEDKNDFTVAVEARTVTIHQGFRLSGSRGLVTEVTINFLECYWK